MEGDAAPDATTFFAARARRSQRGNTDDAMSPWKLPSPSAISKPVFWEYDICFGVFGC